LADVNGSTPRRVWHGFVWPALAPDGHSFLVAQNGNPQNGNWTLQSVSENINKPVRGIQAGEVPIAWASDSQHVYAQIPSPAGATIYKVNLETGQRELWQELRPKDSVGLVPMRGGAGITPDGRWIAFTSTTQLSQLYRSDTLK